MPIGFPGGGMFSRSGGGTGLNNLLNMGGGEPDLNMDQINQMLQQFGGVSLPGSGPSQMGGPFENMGGLSRRAPALAYGLDNALIALANMGPTGSTIGENISNSARGLQSIGPTRRAQQAAPIMMGLDLAQKVGQVNAQGEYMKYMKSMSDYYSQRNDTQTEIANTRLKQAAMKQELVGQKDPMLSTGGKVLLPEYNDTTGKVEYIEHPEIDPKSVHHQSLIKSLGGSDLAKGFVMSRAGNLPSNDQEMQQFGKDFLDLQSKMRVMGPGVTAAAAGTRQEQGEFFTSQKGIYSNLLNQNTSPKERQDRIDNRVIELTTQGQPYPTAMRTAQSEEDQRVQKLNNAWGQFSLLDEKAQRAAGGFQGYYSQQDGTGQKPSGNRATPQSRTLGNPTPQAVKPTAGPANLDQLSPNVRALIQSLQLSPQPQQ